MAVRRAAGRSYALIGVIGDTNICDSHKYLCIYGAGSAVGDGFAASERPQVLMSYTVTNVRLSN